MAHPVTSPQPNGPDWDTAARPYIVGHRGVGNIGAPENTIPAFDLAAAAGASIETDIYTTSDDVPVLIHDRNPLRTTGVSGDVMQMTLTQVRTLNAARGWDPALYPFVPIPTLDEYVTRYSGKSLLLPELKGGDVAAISAVLARAARRGLLVQSFSADQLGTLKQLMPGVRVQLLGAAIVPPSTLTSLGAWSIGLAAGAITAEYVASCHAVGLRVIAWVVDDGATARHLTTDLGVDGIITDDPAKMRSELGL
jgi:glycerophosphoryl diester phosphodiesterase